jgi:hypothetical protein
MWSADPPAPVAEVPEPGAMAEVPAEAAPVDRGVEVVESHEDAAPRPAAGTSQGRAPIDTKTRSRPPPAAARERPRPAETPQPAAKLEPRYLDGSEL